MQAVADGSAASEFKLPARGRVVTPIAIIGFLGVFAFIATEVGAFYAATVWAVAGLLGLGGTALIVLAAIMAAPCIWALVWTARLAWLAETDPENN